jgi:hypothetical protein
MRFFLFLSCLVGFCCGEAASPPAVLRVEKMAQGYCDCAGTLAALNAEAAKMAADSTLAPQFQAQLKAIELEYQRAKECSIAIIGQYGRLQAADYPDMEKALGKHCPKLAPQRDLLRELLGE